MDLSAILAFWGLHDQPQAGRAEHQCRARNSSHHPLMCCCLPTRAQAGRAFLALKLSDHQQWWWWWWSWWACGGHFQSSLVRLEPRDVGQVDRQHNSAPRHSYTHAHTCRSLLSLFVCFKTSLSAIFCFLWRMPRKCPYQSFFFFKCPCLSSTTVQQPNNDHGVLEAIIKIIVSVTIISPTSHLPSLLPNEKDNFRFTGPQHYWL